MAITLSEGNKEEVRKAIDVALTKDELPDDVIGLGIYEGEAVSQIENAIKELTDEQKTTHAATILRAVVYLTASLLVPTLKVITSETLEGDRWTFQNKDLAKLGESLESKAFGVISRLLELVLDKPTPTDSDFASGLFDIARACPK